MSLQEHSLSQSPEISSTPEKPMSQLEFNSALRKKIAKAGFALVGHRKAEAASFETQRSEDPADYELAA